MTEINLPSVPAAQDVASRFEEVAMNDTAHHFTQDETVQARPQAKTYQDVWRSCAIDMPLSFTGLSRSLGNDCARFLSHRLQAQAKHLDELAHCQSMADAMRLQIGFVTQSWIDYQNETGKFFNGHGGTGPSAV